MFHGKEEFDPSNGNAVLGKEGSGVILEFIVRRTMVSSAHFLLRALANPLKPYLDLET
jgi:hypothetical protein